MDPDDPRNDFELPEGYDQQEDIIKDSDQDEEIEQFEKRLKGDYQVKKKVAFGPITSNSLKPKEMQKLYQNIIRIQQKQPLIEPPKTKTIEDIQKELQKSKKPRTDDDEIQEVIESSNESLKDKKIRELAAKVKNMQLAYEKEKLARTKIETQLQQAMKDTDEKIQMLDLKTKKQAQPDPLVKTLKKEDASSTIQPEDLQKKYKEADKKIQEQRVLLQNLKSELNKATRIISREIGSENLNLDQILSEENAWKGRAQQIEILKGKVKELQQKLGNQSQYSESMQQTQNSQFSAKSDAKRQQLDQMKQTIEQLKQENDALQSKWKGAASRKQILENEIKEVKQDFEKSKKILMDKSDNDDRYIQALKQELEKARKQVGQVETKIIYKQANENRNEIENQNSQNLNTQFEQENKKVFSYFLLNLIISQSKRQNIQERNQNVMKVLQKIQSRKQLFLNYLQFFRNQSYLNLNKIINLYNNNKIRQFLIILNRMQQKLKNWRMKQKYTERRGMNFLKLLQRILTLKN